jgi:hypothetical protein
VIGTFLTTTSPGCLAPRHQQGIEVGAMRAAVAEELDHFDLAASSVGWAGVIGV